MLKPPPNVHCVSIPAFGPTPQNSILHLNLIDPSDIIENDGGVDHMVMLIDKACPYRHGGADGEPFADIVFPSKLQIDHVEV